MILYLYLYFVKLLQVLFKAAVITLVEINFGRNKTCNHFSNRCIRLFVFEAVQNAASSRRSLNTSTRDLNITVKTCSRAYSFSKHRKISLHFVSLGPVHLVFFQPEPNHGPKISGHLGKTLNIIPFLSRILIGKKMSKVNA